MTGADLPQVNEESGKFINAVLRLVPSKFQIRAVVSAFARRVYRSVKTQGLISGLLASLTFSFPFFFTTTIIVLIIDFIRFRYQP